MSDDDAVAQASREFFGFMLLAVFLGLLTGGVVGVSSGISHERMRAVEAGAAEWVTDSQTGKTQFVYRNKQ